MTLKADLLDIGVYLLLFQDDDKNVLIEAGPANINQKNLAIKLRELSVKKIDYLILTHGHTDHVGGAKWIKEHYGASVIAHPDCVSFLFDPYYELKNYWEEYLRFFKYETRVKFKKDYWKTRGRDSCRVDKTVREGDTLNVGSLRFKIIETPGHIDGSISILEENTKILFLGDAIQGLGPCSSIVNTLPLYFDVNEYLKTLDKIMEINAKYFILAHPYKPLCNPILSRADVIKFIKVSKDFVKSFEASILEILLKEKEGITFINLGQKLSNKFGSDWPSVGLAPTIYSHIKRMVKRNKVKILGSMPKIIILKRNNI